MSKLVLQGSVAAYSDLLNNALEAERAGCFIDAIRHAVAAWVYVEDMMKYKRRWEQAEFKSVPCIDLVLKYAPLLLDNQCLNRLENLLRERRSIDKHASDDLASRLAEARANPHR